MLYSYTKDYFFSLTTTEQKKDRPKPIIVCDVRKLTQKLTTQ